MSAKALNSIPSATTLFSLAYSAFSEGKEEEAFSLTMTAMRRLSETADETESDPSLERKIITVLSSLASDADEEEETQQNQVDVSNTSDEELEEANDDDDEKSLSDDDLLSDSNPVNENEIVTRSDEENPNVDVVSIEKLKEENSSNLDKEMSPLERNLAAMAKLE